MTRIVLLTDDVEQIAQRSLGRDNQSFSTEFIANHQEQEIKHAIDVSEKFSIPITILKASD